MNRFAIHAIFAAAALALGTAAHAQDAKKGEAAAKQSCLTCHAVGSKKVGPALKEAAAKYKKDKADAAKVAATIKGVKAHDLDVKDDDLKNIGAWLLTL